MQKNTRDFTVNPNVLFMDLKDTAAMYWAVIRGKYPLPKRSLFWTVLFLAYFVIPFDFVPEAMFLVLGFSDDLLLLVYVLNKMRPDLDNYRDFTDKNKKNRKKAEGGEIENEKTV